MRLDDLEFGLDHLHLLPQISYLVHHCSLVSLRISKRGQLWDLSPFFVPTSASFSHSQNVQV